MAVNLSALAGAGQQFFTDVGVPLSGGKLYSYAAGTTTPQATYTTAAGTVAHANPIILDSAGRVSTGEIWLTAGSNYKFVLKTSTDVTLATWDNITGINGTGIASNASNVQYDPAGTGAVSTTVQAKLRLYVSPQDFGAVGNGTTDDTAAIQAAVNASLDIDFGGAGYSYKVNGTITLRTGQTLIGSGATVTQTANNTALFNIVAKTDIRITGFKMVGVGSDFSDSDSSLAVAIYGNGSEARIWVENNYFYNFSYTTLRAKGSTDVVFTNNVVVGPGLAVLTPITSGKCYGVLADSGCNRFIVTNNSISNTAIGIRIEASSNINLENNSVFNIVAQHGFYVGTSNLNVNIVGNTVYNTRLVGIKIQAANSGTSNYNVTIVGNTVDTCLDQGILLQNANSASAQAVQNINVTVTGNTVRNITSTGINIQNVNKGVISSNSVDVCTTSGINLSGSSFLEISNNVVSNIQLSGIRDQAECTNYSIKNNRVYNAAQANTPGDNFGIFVQNVNNTEISNNTISDSNAKMKYGIYTAGGTQTSLILTGNYVLNSVDNALRLANATDALIAYKNNYFVAPIYVTFNDPAIPSVASAATITLSTAQDVFLITGTVYITSILPNGHSGHRVTLIFNNVLQVTSGSNLLLAGNFITTAYDTLTLVCDGANWFETSRSVN
jgi:parallel beta-helix repeat protein